MDLYFTWVNDPEVRRYSFNGSEVAYEEHKRWFQARMNDPDTVMYVFEDGSEPIGQVRFQDDSHGLATIGLSIAGKFRGRGYASKMIATATDDFLSKRPSFLVRAGIKKENLASYRAFLKAGYVHREGSVAGDDNFYLFRK